MRVGDIYFLALELAVVEVIFPQPEMAQIHSAPSIVFLCVTYVDVWRAASWLEAAAKQGCCWLQGCCRLHSGLRDTILTSVSDKCQTASRISCYFLLGEDLAMPSYMF